MKDENVKPVFMGLSEFCRTVGIGRTKGDQLQLRRGVIPSTYIGGSIAIPCSVVDQRDCQPGSNQSGRR